MEKDKSFIEKAEAEQKAMNWFVNKKVEVTATGTTNQYECFDSWVDSGSTQFIAEVKVRKEYTSTQIEGWGGAYVEFTKIEGIRQYKEYNNKTNRVLYFNYFADCLKIYELPTEPSQYQWELKWLPKDNFNKGNKINKFVAKLTDEFLIETIKYKK